MSHPQSGKIQVVFATPRKLPRPASLSGRVVVLDIAFAADGTGSSFEKVTEPFLRGLGDRLAAWIDHHDHELHARYASDPRFVLCKKSEHGACPEMVTEARVAAAGDVQTVVCHNDMDGLYAAAKWLRGGTEPYPGADDDARAVDTRMGSTSALGSMIDRALRARPKDDALRALVVDYLTGGARDHGMRADIDEASAEFEQPRGQRQAFGEGVSQAWAGSRGGRDWLRRTRRVVRQNAGAVARATVGEDRSRL